MIGSFDGNVQRQVKSYNEVKEDVDAVGTASPTGAYATETGSPAATATGRKSSANRNRELEAAVVRSAACGWMLYAFIGMMG